MNGKEVLIQNIKWNFATEMIDLIGAWNVDWDLETSKSVWKSLGSKFLEELEELR